jgi:nucleoside-diphosphate-sugar epimerase
MNDIKGKRILVIGGAGFIERLVHSSSASVYGDAMEIPMTEEHPFNNRTFNGATKIAGEAMARAFMQDTE